ncbi:TetR/AcrR family transcriptional regulator [Agromyces humatus]|uniref:TetR/AcrR family transcriptional regulator n=1 Tax=Agromyces humatus TaxID=279573 RepID=UPI001E2DE6DC|nr:TetR/AcrR family transcriptional regulator [Agromyces humatus]
MSRVRPTESTSVRARRVDASRNERILLEAAAGVFAERGVNAPVRLIAVAAGVGMGTIYRHFPTRADLVIAVYRHQVESCAAAGRVLLAESSSPAAALHAWVDLFVEFLVTKHGLAQALRDDRTGFDALHDYFLDRLVPVCGELLTATTPDTAEPAISAYQFMRGIGNLCIRAPEDEGYDPRPLVRLLISGVLHEQDQRAGTS